MRKEEERRAKYRLTHCPPDESLMERRCAACRKWEGELNPVTFINCPFCIHASPAGKRTKLCVCAKQRPCYEAAIRHHFQSGDCQRRLEIQERISVYTGFTRSSYDDPYEDEVVQSLDYPVNQSLSETTFGLIERWFYRRASTCKNDNPVFELQGYPEEATLDDHLWAIYHDKGVLRFTFCGA